MKRSGPLTRKTPLAKTSKAKRAELAERRKMMPPGTGTCALLSRSCDGPLDRHELVRRPHWRKAATDPRLVIWLCRHHHDMDLHKDLAVELGIRIDPHEWHRAVEAGTEDELVAHAEQCRQYARSAGLA